MLVQWRGSNEQFKPQRVKGNPSEILGLQGMANTILSLIFESRNGGSPWFSSPQEENQGNVSTGFTKESFNRDSKLSCQELWNGEEDEAHVERTKCKHLSLSYNQNEAKKGAWLSWFLAVSESTSRKSKEREHHRYTNITGASIQEINFRHQVRTYCCICSIEEIRMLTFKINMSVGYLSGWNKGAGVAQTDCPNGMMWLDDAWMIQEEIGHTRDDMHWFQSRVHYLVLVCLSR